MPETSPPAPRPKNRILRALPPEDFERLQADLATIPIHTRDVLHHAGQPVQYVYFPNGGVVSVTTVLSDGRTVETATVGVEGMVGIEAIFSGDPIAQGETMIQVPDTSAERLGVTALRRELAHGGALSDLMGRYSEVVLGQMMQSAACNALHHIDQRCARWLLMTHDRVEQDEFQLSHEFLAVMLGVRRQSVTEVAGTLQSAGFISYKRGVICILDRPRLEATSCECYAAIRDRFDRLSC